MLVAIHRANTIMVKVFPISCSNTIDMKFDVRLLCLPLLFLGMEVRLEWQVHAVNLIEIKLGEIWQPISIQS